jgi:hypothetical protein
MLNNASALQVTIDKSSGTIRTLTAVEIDAVAGGEAPSTGDGTTGPYNPNPPHKQFT